MRSLISFPPWPFGPKRPEFYLCKCENCGFMRKYEVSDCDIVTLDDADSASDSAFEQVKTLPAVCPECGKKLKKAKLTSPIKY